MMNFVTPAFMLSFLQMCRSVLLLAMHGFALAWVFHKLSPHAVTVDSKTVFHYMMKILISGLCVGVFIMLVSFGVLLITAKLQCVPLQAAAEYTAANGAALIIPMSFISICITTIVQIILIELPAHISKRTFMTILFVLNLGMSILSWLAQLGLEKLFV